MKILLVTPWFPSLKPESMESRQGIFEYRQVNELVKRGNEIRVISVKWSTQLSYEYYIDALQVYRLKPIFTFNKIRYPIPNLITLTKKIRKINQDWRPDIVIYSHIAYLITLPPLWLKEIPSLVTTDAFPGISWFYGDNIVDFIARLYTKLIVTKVIKASDGIQFLSHKPLQDEKVLKVKFKNAFVCSTGVDTALFKPGNDRTDTRIKLGISENEISILYVGRLDLVKGVNYLIEATKLILKKYDNVTLFIVGEGSLKQKYETLSNSNTQKIMFLGWRDDIPQLMRMADMFILPSLSEGAPNVIMEASSSGLPVIVSDVGEVPQIVENGVTGIIVKPRDVDSLVSAMDNLIAHPLLMKKMGEAGRNKMLKEYSWDTICKRLENNYKNIIASKNHES
jgi:glycosyltransferase involved in cell wall biosynthesis